MAKGKLGTPSQLTYPVKSSTEEYLKRQEAYWARRAGKVETHQLTDEEKAERKPAKRIIVDSPFRRNTTRAETQNSSEKLKPEK